MRDLKANGITHYTQHHRVLRCLSEWNHLMIVTFRSIIFQQTINQIGAEFGKKVDARDPSFLKLFFGK